MEHYLTLVGIGVQTALFLLGGYAMVLRNDWSNKALKAELVAMQRQLEKLSEVITIQAVQTTRIDNLHQQITMLQRNYEDLRRGTGIIERD